MVLPAEVIVRDRSQASHKSVDESNTGENPKQSPVELSITRWWCAFGSRLHCMLAVWRRQGVISKITPQGPAQLSGFPVPPSAAVPYMFPFLSNTMLLRGYPPSSPPVKSCKEV